MNIHQVIARYLMAIGLILLASSIVYFSYAIVYTVNRVPDIIVEINDASLRLDRALDNVEKISDMIPQIIEQSDMYQQKIPLILAEVKSNRMLVPDVLKEVERVRKQIPPILIEIKAVREELPGLINELEAYRKLTPEVLAEVAAVRKSIPPTLDRAERLTKDAKIAGQKASEGAVTGFFSGLVKLPFNMFKGVQGKFKYTDLTESDIQEIRLAAIVALQSDIGSIHNWSNPDTKHTGEVSALSEEFVEGLRCRQLRLTVIQSNKKTESTDSVACLQNDGQWNLKL